MDPQPSTEYPAESDRPAPAEPAAEPAVALGRKRRTGRLLLVVLAVLVIFSSGTAAGLVVDQVVLEPNHAANAASAGNIPDTLQQAWNIVHSNYVDTSAIQDSKLLDGAISGMVDALGDTGHSRYLSPDGLKSEQDRLSGSFVGVGISIEQQNNQIVIVAPIANSPAFKAGIEAGDILTKVDGQEVGSMSTDDVAGKVRGPEGSTVQLTLLRPSTNNEYTVTLTRSKIEINPVTWSMLPGQIADIRLSAFSTGAAKDLTDAIQAAQQAGAKGIIFDLRDDAGGYVPEAMGVASAFLPQGSPVYISQTRNGGKQVQRANDSDVRTSLPVVVLVNAGSASASEIVAGALKDDGRAEIIGTKTFGTGTVLNQFNLDNGGAILLGTELWLTPNGQMIREQGITPDVNVTLPSGETPYIPVASGKTLDQIPGDDQLQAAVNVLNGQPVAPSATPAATPGSGG